jgi:hypothetical protein
MADIDPAFHDCQEVVDYICTHFGEEKDSPRCAQLQEHLAQCPDCSTYCDSIEKMIGLYRATSPGFTDRAKTMLLHSLGISGT